MATTNQNNEWDFGWDESWDELPDETVDPSTDAKSSLTNILMEDDTSVGDTLNPLEEVFSNQPLRAEFQAGLPPTQQVEWGVIDDRKPTDLKSRLKNLINPFSKAIEKEEKSESYSSTSPTSIFNEESFKNKDEEKTDDQDQENQAKRKAQNSGIIPRFKSSIAKEVFTSEPIQKVDDLALGFNNLNSISAREMDEINGLLEGSLGKIDSVEFEEEITNDENINFIAHEKKLQFSNPKELESIEEVDEELLQQESTSEETILSETPPDVTLIPDINQIKFDLKSAQENNQLFEAEEMDEVIQRIPIVRQQLIDDGIIEVVQDAFTENEIGESLFKSADSESDLEEEALDTTDDLLDSLLDEIDGELGESSFADSEFDDEFDSFGQDDLLSESDIINDDEESALEFMDSAAMEVDSLFEDFFTQESEEEDTVKEVKASIFDKIIEKINQLKSLQVLILRFLKDPKYFFEYYSISMKDVYVFFGFIFCTIIYTGIINYQALTDRFPMNLF